MDLICFTNCGCAINWLVYQFCYRSKQCARLIDFIWLLDYRKLIVRLTSILGSLCHGVQYSFLSYTYNFMHFELLIMRFSMTRASLRLFCWATIASSWLTLALALRSFSSHCASFCSNSRFRSKYILFQTNSINNNNKKNSTYRLVHRCVDAFACNRRVA